MEGLGVGGKIRLKFIFKKRDGGMETQNRESFCDCGNETPGSIKGGKFLGHLRTFYNFSREKLLN